LKKPSQACANCRKALKTSPRFLLAFANPDAHQFQLSDDQIAEVELAKREVGQGKIAGDAEMTEVWQRFGQCDCAIARVRDLSSSQ